MIATPPPLALTAAPERLSLAGAAVRTVTITNPGRSAAVVDATLAGFALDLRGRPRIVTKRDRSVRISVSPPRVSLGPGRSASVSVSSAVRRGARGGDHVALVLLTTRPRAAGSVGIRMQLGIVVVVRVTGTLHRVLRSAGAHLHGARLELGFRNVGNVIATIGSRTFRVVLLRGRHVVAVLRPAPRELLPASRGDVRVQWPPRIRGRLRVRVEVDDGAGGILRSTFSVSRRPRDR